MNQIFLVGNLTKDIELRENESGLKRASFSIAVKRNYKNQNGEYESDFFNCIAFNNTAEYLSKYTKKGMKVALQGRLQNRTYESDGTKKQIIEIVVNEVSMMTAPKEEVKEEKKEEPKKDVFEEFSNEFEIQDSDLPF